MKDIIYREDATRYFIGLQALDKITNDNYDGKITFEEVISRLGVIPSVERTKNEERIRNSVNLLRALLIQSKDKDITLDHDTIEILYETLKSCLSN